MRKQKLREWSKFFSGLVAGDFLCGLWLYSAGYLPMQIFGVSFNEQHVMAWLVFDVLLFAFLVYHGWHMSDWPKSKKEKGFHTFIGIVFGVVALIHLSRIAFGFDFVFGDWNMPFWLNGIATIVTGFLSYTSLTLAHKE